MPKKEYTKKSLTPEENKIKILICTWRIKTENFLLSVITWVLQLLCYKWVNVLKYLYFLTFSFILLRYATIYAII